jgi:hypothetical protein
MGSVGNASKGGCLIVVGGLFAVLVALVGNSTPATQQPGGAAVTPPMPAAQQPDAAAVTTPTPDPDAGKLRGTKETGTWDSTWVTLDTGKKFMAITSVKLDSNLRVSMTNPFGTTALPVDKVPQGFLDSWGITGTVIDQGVAAQAEKIKQQAALDVHEQQAHADAALDAQAQEVGFKVVQIINSNEILALQHENLMIHISGINTSNMAEDDIYNLKLWRDGVYRYVSVLGASSQIQSFTASRDEASVAR